MTKINQTFFSTSFTFYFIFCVSIISIIPLFSIIINSSIIDFDFTLFKNILRGTFEYYKANTNDFRESPSYFISKELLDNGANLIIHDPKVSYKQINLALKNISTKIEFDSNFSCTNDLNSAFENADAIVILTEWEQYKNLNWEKISKLMRYPAWVFDTRNILEKSHIQKLGMKIWSLGDGYLN